MGYGPEVVSKVTRLSSPNKDAITIGLCNEDDASLMQCSGTCNDLIVGGSCPKGGKCTVGSGQNYTVTISCKD